MCGFGEKIRYLRKQKNVSILEMSRDIGYSKSIINYWETNKKEPTISALRTLCDYFDEDANYLIGRQDY